MLHHQGSCSNCAWEAGNNVKFEVASFNRFEDISITVPLRCVHFLADIISIILYKQHFNSLTCNLQLIRPEPSRLRAGLRQLQRVPVHLRKVSFHSQSTMLSSIALQTAASRTGVNLHHYEATENAEVEISVRSKMQGGKCSSGNIGTILQGQKMWELKVKNLLVLQRLFRVPF